MYKRSGDERVCWSPATNKSLRGGHRQTQERWSRFTFFFLSVLDTYINKSATLNTITTTPWPYDSKRPEAVRLTDHRRFAACALRIATILPTMIKNNKKEKHRDGRTQLNKTGLHASKTARRVQIATVFRPSKYRKINIRETHEAKQMKKWNCDLSRVVLLIVSANRIETGLI